MKCLLLGEGPTDLGSKEVLPDTGLHKGPMTLAIDALAAAQGIGDIEYELLSRVDVKKGLKNSRRIISSRPKQIDAERLTFFRSAWYLGVEAQRGSKDLSVYFHDPDRTQAGSEKTPLLVEQAMLSGFELSGFANGVPMVPNPRSEAWLLAYFQKGLPRQREYNKAERFESLPANDESPNSAKKLLQKAIGASSPSTVYGIVMERMDEVDWTRVSMPSYNRFRARLEHALTTILTLNR